MEENKKAMAMREEMLGFSELKAKYEVSTAECQSYRYKISPGVNGVQD